MPMRVATSALARAAVVAAAVGLAGVASGCAERGPTTPPGAPGFVREVTAVAIAGTRTCPRRLEVAIEGRRGACDAPLDPEVAREGGEIVLRLPVRSDSRPCLRPEVEHRVRVPLALDLPPGEYRLRVMGENEVTTRFQVAPCPAPPVR